MTQRERRIFVYTPPEREVDDRQPEPDAGPGPVRSWFFSPVGLICAWVIAVGLLVPIAALVLVTLREPFVILVFGFGLWAMLGLIVVHWWIPSANPRHFRSEGIAAAGWHVGLTVAATGIVAWFSLFRDGVTAAFTLSDTRPVVAAGVVFTVAFGLGVLWARGHGTERTARYAVMGSAMFVTWMSLWLVASHGGLLPPQSLT